MQNSQYDKVKKYRKNRIGIITTRNIIILIIIVSVFISVGYSYWNTTLHITGTAVIAGNIGGGGSGTETDPYIVPDVPFDPGDATNQDNGTGNSHSYSGFNLFYYYSSRGSNPARYLRTQSFSNKSSLSGQNMSSGNNLRKVDTTITSYYTARTRYTFDITYTNSNAQVSVTSSINGGTPSTQTFTSDVTNLSQATVCIGCNGIDSSENVETLEVLAFSVEKN